MKRPDNFIEYVKYLEELKIPKPLEIDLDPKIKITIVGVGDLDVIIAHYNAIPYLIDGCKQKGSFNFSNWETARNTKVKSIKISIKRGSTNENKL